MLIQTALEVIGVSAKVEARTDAPKKEKPHLRLVSSFGKPVKDETSRRR